MSTQVALRDTKAVAQSRRMNAILARLVRAYGPRPWQHWGKAVDVLVPPGCEVRLNAESIRLRLLEPGDPVELDVIESADGTVAAAVRTGRAV